MIDLYIEAFYSLGLITDESYADLLAVHKARCHGSVMFDRAFPCTHARWDEDEAGRTCMDCARPLPRDDQ